MKRKKKIQQLVRLSLTQGKLDAEKIVVIAKMLTKKEQAVYLRLLLRKREEEKVHIAAAVDVPADFVLRVKRLFPDKDVFFAKDPTLLGGLAMRLSDIVFNASLRAYLENVKRVYGEIN